jgi:hypothetical protein
VHALFDRLFPRGFAGQDVLDEVAPEGWERSPLLACFHPSVERIFEERLQTHRNLEELRGVRQRHDSSTAIESSPEPTLDELRGITRRLRCDSMTRSPSWLDSACGTRSRTTTRLSAPTAA